MGTVEESVLRHRRMHPGISQAELDEYRQHVEGYARQDAEKLREIVKEMGLRWPRRREEPQAEGEVFDITPEVSPDEETQREAYQHTLADQRRRQAAAQAQVEVAWDATGGFGADPGETIFE